MTWPNDDRLLDDRAGDRRAHRRVLEPLLGDVERWCARGSTGACALAIVELRRLVLLRGDDALLEQLVGALLLRLRDLELRLGGVEIGLGLIVLVLHVARLELHEQLAGLYLEPVSTVMRMIWPDDLDFTSTTLIGSTPPDAVASSTMSRRVTGAVWTVSIVCSSLAHASRVQARSRVDERFTDRG